MSAASSAFASSGALCQICFEPVQERLALPKLATGNSDVIRSEDCMHPICRGCMALYVASRVAEQRVSDVCCPAVGCKTRLFEQDVNSLVASGALGAEVRDRFVEIRVRDYGARAREFSDAMSQTLRSEDYAVLRRLWETTKLCPRCSLAIERSQGCPSFYCICGHHFNYDQAPRAVGAGVRNFGRVITLAQHLQISVKDAQTYGDCKIYHKAARTAESLGISMEEACELHKEAEQGDEVSRGRIRHARALQRGAPLQAGRPQGSLGPDAVERGTDGQQRDAADARAVAVEARSVGQKVPGFRESDVHPIGGA